MHVPRQTHVLEILSKRPRAFSVLSDLYSLWSRWASELSSRLWSDATLFPATAAEYRRQLSSDMAFMAVLESDLRALSTEARRRHPAVKDGAEHAILKVGAMIMLSSECHSDSSDAFAFCFWILFVQLQLPAFSCSGGLVFVTWRVVLILLILMLSILDHILAKDTIKFNALSILLLWRHICRERLLLAS